MIAPDSQKPAEGRSTPCGGWALEIELDTHFDSRAGIVAQLHEIARQIERGGIGGRGSGSGGSCAWTLRSKAPNGKLIDRRGEARES